MESDIELENESATTFVFVERSSQVRATKNTWPYYCYRETAGKLKRVPKHK